MKTTLIVAAAVSAAMLASCALNIPQTRSEFVAHPKILKETYTVPRNLEAVSASLDKQARQCVNSTLRTGAGKMMPGSNDAYEITVEKTSQSRAELTYRWATSNGAMQPKGGYLMMLGDLEAQGAKSTKVTLYHPGETQAKLTNALKEWSKGNTDSCHGYVAQGYKAK